ncbi:uncharacterized protein TNCV_5006111 [Trichonephila clavipes]|uniref:Transposase n=1 Tax=Trichonephila clavipes TaxID=2585209 RepID=A0A8X6SC51_TRICX|nr:uncharacterized protein TNCV_5006111 [Trichonephila clavipes]
MITNFFIPELNNHDVQELWFQQDGATCHTARATIDLLKDTFGDRLISRFGPVNWPPRSCDLTPLDYFLWGYVKSLVYADKPQTLDHLNCGGGDRGRVAIYRPFGEVSLSLNRTVTCMVLKANDRRTSCPCHDEFRGPRSDYVRQGRLFTTPGVLPQNWGENEPNSTVTCMVLKSTANDRRHLALCHDEFRGPRSGLCRSGDKVAKNDTTDAKWNIPVVNSTTFSKQVMAVSYP